MAAIPWNTALTGHLHNKIVHFPLALGLAAAVILLVAPRWPAYEPAARVLLIAGALVAIAAYLSGGAQEEPFEDSPFHSVVELHEKLGIATAIVLWCGVALTFRRKRPSVHARLRADPHPSARRHGIPRRRLEPLLADQRGLFLHTRS